MVYDALGRERAQVDPLGYRTTNVFNAAGQTVSQIDARGNRHSFTYDAAGAQTQQVDALLRRTTLAYDAAGQQTLRLDARGYRTTYVYDSVSQVIGRRYPDGSRATFAYNPTGQRTSMTNGFGGYDSFRYDPLGQMIITQGNLLKVTFSYDALGNRRSRILSPSTIVTFVYDSNNQLSVAQDHLIGPTTYTYDAAGQRVLTRFPNGTRCSQSYDASQRITQVHSRTSSGTAIVTYDYQYDAAANRIAVVEANGDRVTWSYDAGDRLLSERRSGANSYAHTFSYDAVGNRLVLKADAARTTFNYDIANQLTFSINSTGRTTFGYDASGNQQLEIGPSGARTTTSWDYENQPRLYELGASRVTMAYNADQRRVIKNTPVESNSYVWDPVYDTYLFRLQEPGPMSASLYTNEPVQFGRLVSEYRLLGVGSGTNIFHTDALGSVRAITNSSQTTLNTYDYGAWGRDVAASESIPNEFRWVGIYGYYYDVETGLYYIRARTYQPAIARWTSVDPLFYMLARAGVIGLGSKEGVGIADGMNVYLYGNVNPVIFIDPSGTTCGELWFSCGTSIISEKDVVGMPWHKKKLPKDTLGFTSTSKTFNCECIECCGGKWQLESINVLVGLEIHIDVDQLTPLDPPLSRVYGHEQLHVLNMIKGMQNDICPVVENFFNTGSSSEFQSRELCEASCAITQRVFLQLYNTLVWKEGHPAGASHDPKKGIGYPPIQGIFPPNPVGVPPLNPPRVPPVIIILP